MIKKKTLSIYNIQIASTKKVSNCHSKPKKDIKTISFQTWEIRIPFLASLSDAKYYGFMYPSWISNGPEGNPEISREGKNWHLGLGPNLTGVWIENGHPIEFPYRRINSFHITVLHGNYVLSLMRRGLKSNRCP